jgi:NDP-sugar pyrophosphorylase family protein
MKDIQVLILAGGMAKRMWPMTTHKNMLPFFGKPLLVHTLDNFKKAGFKNFIIVVNPAIKEGVKKWVGKAKVVVQKKALGQADAILSAEKAITNDPLLIINANDFYQSILLNQMKKKIKTDLDACLVGLKTDHYLPMGYLVVKGGLVKAIIEKPGKGREPSKMIRLVFDFYREPKVLLQFLKKTKSKLDDVYEVAMTKMMQNGMKFGLVEYQDQWATIKYPWDILRVRDFFLEAKKRKRVVMASGVRLFEGAVVKNSYLGKNVIVGNNALVRDSIIEEGCVIGYNTEIARSYVGPHCWFHVNYIGDSVIEENVSFGSGARTANLRLDEQEIFVEKEGEKISTGLTKLGTIAARGVRVGINTSIMPGVMIGSGSFVGPGMTLNQNLQENKFCYPKQNLIIKKKLLKADLGSRDKFKKNL